MNNPIALLSDFGNRDWFVAGMKAVILSVHPRAVIVDINHEIPPCDIAAGAFNLLACHSFFPKGTIFIAVVDPGVGTNRAALAIKAGGYFFVGPDNGLFSLVLDKYYKAEIRSLENTKYFLKEISSTFHGRDIFAPVGAHLSAGVAFEKLGPKVLDVIRLPMAPRVRVVGKKIKGTVAYIDRFGNAITTVSSSLVHRTGRVRIKGRDVPLRGSYADVKVGEPVAVVGSCGFVEISVHRGNAATAFGLRLGDTVTIFG